ncbi:AAA family ATPase [bacterium]|nr:AAA family ATPase [bacterium]
MNPFFESPAYQEAVARLEYALERHDRVAVLTGLTGSGKTTLLENWTADLRRRGVIVVYLPTPGTFEHDLLWELAIGLKAEISLSSTPSELWFRIREQLTAYSLEQRQVVIAVDHFEEIARETGDILLSLARLHYGDGNLGSLVLSVDKQALRTLDLRLLKMADLKIELEAWDVDDVASFTHAYLAANHQDQVQLSDEVIAAVSQQSAGLPRIVSQILDLTCLAAEASQAESVSPETILAVREELL